MIREFARHVVSIDARSGGRAVRLRKLDKHTWQAARCTGPLEVRCTIYAWDLSVRAAHLDGTPELLSASENLAVLDRLVDHFEDRMPVPRRLNGTAENAAYAARISAGTVGFRLRVTRVVAKSKLSQNRPAETVTRILAELEGSGPYASPTLATEMRRVHGQPGPLGDRS